MSQSPLESGGGADLARRGGRGVCTIGPLLILHSHFVHHARNLHAQEAGQEPLRPRTSTDGESNVLGLLKTLWIHIGDYEMHETDFGGHGSESAVGTEEGACLALRRKRAGNQRSVARGRSAPCTHTLRTRGPFLTLELSSPSASHRCLLLRHVG